MTKWHKTAVSRRMIPAVLAVSVLIMGTASVCRAGDGTEPAAPHLDRSAMPAPGKVMENPTGGFIAPRFQTAHYAAAVAANLRHEKTLPSRYDARALGMVTPVKNQGDCGACYAFSSAADLESKVMRDGQGIEDLSEESMKDCNFQGTGCGGGNQFLIMNYLATHGADLETCAPYVPADAGCPLGCQAKYTVLDFSVISGSTVAPTEVIKQYLMDYGPIHTTIFAGDDTQPGWRDQVVGYDGTGALFYEGTELPNHSVLIVGWDDMVAHAGGTGAWIVKNSWGTSWGGTCDYGTERGYFYIAYGSANVGMYSSFVKEFMHNYSPSEVLYHDEGGYTSAFGGLGTVLWGMSAFTATEDTRLHRVEFWTSDATVDVDVYVYANFSGGALSTLRMSSLDNSFAEPGYHYVQFIEPLALTAGEDFYVAVRFENESYVYPLTADNAGPAASGKSWYSFNGATWSSLEPHAVDTTIRARTSTNTVLSVEDHDGSGDPDPDPGQVPRRLEIKGAYPNPFNPTTNITFELPGRETVRVGIFDLQGREIRRLVNETAAAGTRTVTWDGQDDQGRQVPSGVYFCRVEAGYQVRSIKLAVLK